MLFSGRSVGVESGVPVLVSGAVPVMVSWSGGGTCALDRGGDAELDEGVVCPGHCCGLVKLDVVEGGENRVQEVSSDMGRFL